MRVFVSLVTTALSLCAFAAPLANPDLDAPGLNARLIPTAQNLTARSTGEGGFLNLDNSGPYTWKRIHVHSYQMNSWDKAFPDTVAPYSTQRVYVEYDTTATKNHDDDGGEVVFQIDGTTATFQLQARAPKSGRTLQFVPLTFSIINHAEKSVVELGWSHDGLRSFWLSGDAINGWISSEPPTDWMQKTLKTTGGLTLRRLSIPGSHDAGMAKLTSSSEFSTDCNTKTQRVDIGGQLAAGSRYFDIRPLITFVGKEYLTSHFTEKNIDLEIPPDIQVKWDHIWLGSTGQPIGEIVTQINAFLKSNQELVILDLSHSLSSSVEFVAWPSFNAGEWAGLFNQLLAIEHRFTSDRLPAGQDASKIDLSTIQLKDFIGSAPAVIILVPGGADMKDWYSKGFFDAAQLPIYNNYSDTDDLNKMLSDQQYRLAGKRDPIIDKDGNQCNKPLCLYSNTLTQGLKDIAACAFGVDSKSIISLADEANPHVYTDLLGKVPPSSGNTPNIIYIDSFTNSDIVGISMAYNHWNAGH